MTWRFKMHSMLLNVKIVLFDCRKRIFTSNLITINWFERLMIQFLLWTKHLRIAYYFDSMNASFVDDLSRETKRCLLNLIFFTLKFSNWKCKTFISTLISFFCFNTQFETFNSYLMIVFSSKRFFFIFKQKSRVFFNLEIIDRKNRLIFLNIERISFNHCKH